MLSKGSFSYNSEYDANSRPDVIGVVPISDYKQRRATGAEMIASSINGSKRYFGVAAAVLTVTVVIFSLLTSGCGSTGPAKSTMVYVVYDSPKGDRSFSDSVYAGLFKAQEEHDFLKEEFNVREINELDAMFTSRTFAKGKPDLVIVAGYVYQDYSERWASKNPAIAFLLIDHRRPNLPNARTVEATAFGSSYLAGILAAKATKTGKVGIILGTPSWVLDDFRKGYEEGVRFQNSGTEMREHYISDNTSGFQNPEEGKRIANEMYDLGYDVIYAVAGGSGLGIIEAAKAKEGRFVIGVDWDQTSLGPKVILASVVKNLDNLVYQTITQYLEGTFEPGVFRIGLKEGATGLVFNPKFKVFEPEVMMFYDQAVTEEER